MDDNPPLLSFFSGLSFEGDANTNNQSQLTGKMGYHGSSLLAQLHQEWLKLWGSLNSTITRIKPTEGSVTVADSNAVPLSPDLTVDCLCLTVSMCDWKTRNTKKKPRFCSLNTVWNQKWDFKTKTKPHWSTLDIISASSCLIPWCLYDWFSVCAWVCTCCVPSCQQTLELLGPSTVQACWNVIVLILYFQRCFRAYEKISFMFL